MHDRWLLDAHGGWPTKSNPIRAFNPADLDIWWFAPNLAGVSLPDAALVAAIWKNCFNIVILQEEANAPEWVIDQPRSLKQREVKDIKQENKKIAGRGLESLVYGCSCA